MTSHPSRALARLALLATLLTGAPGRAHSQPTRLGVPAGSRIRVTRCPSGADVCGPRLDGVLVGQDSAGLAVGIRDSTARIPWQAVYEVEAYRGSHGALRAVALSVGGLALGSVLGIAAGAFLQGDCYELGCLAGPAYGLLAGASLGLAAGITIAVTTRERWTTAYRTARPMFGPEPLVAGTRVRVGIRIPLGR